MNVLLDTHAFLWFMSGDSKLSAIAKQEIENPDNQKLVSVASLWEMGIKISLGKLTLQKPFNELIPRQIEDNGFELLNIKLDHISKLTLLAYYHRDPFDRMLASQCLSDELPIISCDETFDNYIVKRIW